MPTLAISGVPFRAAGSPSSVRPAPLSELCGYPCLQLPSAPPLHSIRASASTPLLPLDVLPPLAGDPRALLGSMARPDAATRESAHDRLRSGALARGEGAVPAVQRATT